MPGDHDFLKNLALVLGVAAVTTVVFQRLRQPVVLGYLLAGLVVGPHVPIPLVADLDTIHTLSELGVILLMFSIGLEFSLRKLRRVGPTAGIVALIQVGFMLWLGYVTARLFGWTRLESLYTGALVAISSTTIIAKAFEEHRPSARIRELVLGVLVVEDLVAILLLVTFGALAHGRRPSAVALGLTAGRLALLLGGLVVVGMLVVPRTIRMVLRMNRSETTLVAAVGLCFAMALLTRALGYSVALGAFLAGSLVAESGGEQAVEQLVGPVRDLFAAIFFVSVGMLIDPKQVAAHWPAVAVLTLVVIVGKVIGVTAGAFLTGNGVRVSVQSGMSLAQIGEFSFIIAGLGLSLEATREFLYPVAVAVSGLTTLVTPWLIRASGPVANLVDRRLPRPLQTFSSLYEAWIDRLRSAPRGAQRSRLRRLVRALVTDAVLLAAITVGTAVSRERVADLLVRRLGLGWSLAEAAIVVLALLLALPFLAGIVHNARLLGVVVAQRVLPGAEQGAVDLARAPRRAFVVALQTACILSLALPLLALTQPFLRPLEGALVLGGVVVALAVMLWRSATDLQGHVRAGAHVLVERLAAQARGTDAPPPAGPIEAMLPGVEAALPVELSSSSPAVGKTLGELNLRGRTGATVLAIQRGDEAITLPSGHDTLRAGDRLALAGTREAVEAARALLT